MILIRTRLDMKMMTVEIKAQHKYRTILLGSLYDDAGLCEPAEGFLGTNN